MFPALWRQLQLGRCLPRIGKAAVVATAAVTTVGGTTWVASITAGYATWGRHNRGRHNLGGQYNRGLACGAA
ncbi:hypothetical protein GCM10017708_16910 [Arthrobacter citreus]